MNAECPSRKKKKGNLKEKRIFREFGFSHTHHCFYLKLSIEAKIYILSLWHQLDLFGILCSFYMYSNLMKINQIEVTHKFQSTLNAPSDSQNMASENAACQILMKPS